MTVRERWAFRARALACLLLALICAALARAWAEEHPTAAGYRLAFEADDTRAAVDCGP